MKCITDFMARLSHTRQGLICNSLKGQLNLLTVCSKPEPIHSISSTGGRLVCGIICFSRRSSSGSGSSSVSSITAGSAGLSPCALGSYMMVELRLRAVLGVVFDGESLETAGGIAVLSLYSSSLVYVDCD